MKQTITIVVLSLLLAISVSWNVLPTAKAENASYQYAYDSDSIHEKIDGNLSDAGLEHMIYLVVTKNPNYDPMDENSGQWYIVKFTE